MHLVPGPSARLLRKPATPPKRRSALLALSEIECQIHIGVDEEERATRQRVVVALRVEGGSRMDDARLRDPLEREVRRYLTEGRFVLVEATILGLARLVFERLPARRVTIRFHKFVLPETDYVAVEMAFRRRDVAGPKPRTRRGR